MIVKRQHLVVLTLFLMGASACGVLQFSLETEAPNEDPVMTDNGTSSEGKNDQLTMKETPLPTGEPTQEVMEERDYSFEPATYHDDESGFELLYPASWTTPGGQVLGSRGYGITFFEQDEIQMQATIYLWDPKRNLEAWSEHREMAWTGSGGTILSKAEWILEGDQAALAYVVEPVEGEDAFFLLSTIGDRYFELAGYGGDLDLLQEIATTVRIPQIDPPELIVDDLDCRKVTDDDPLLWVACNIKDGIVSRNTAALISWMADPFALGYWQSEWTERSPQGVIDELNRYRLPADPSSPMAFTLDREQFPPLFGMPPDQMLHPDIDLALVIYSEGWENDGQGSALLFIAEDEQGGYVWQALLIDAGHFDK